jgi:hypothetical protein
MNPKTSAMVEHLVDQGAIIIHSIDNDGQMLYKITDKLKQVNPDIYRQLVTQYNEHMFRLIDSGPMTMVWKLNG